MFTIADNVVAKAVIVVADDASVPEQHAAAELAEFLEQITGAEIEVVSPPAVDSSRLLVGTWADANWAIAFYEKIGYAVDDVISLGKRLVEDEKTH